MIRRRLPSGDDWYLPRTLRRPAPNHPQITFCGVSTLVITDAETTLIIDGFFTRPSAARMFLGRIAPNPAAIDAGLSRTGVTRADAVLVAHSHFDHALDSAVVAERTGALLVGSSSTLRIGRGAGLSTDQLLAVEVGQAMNFGRFTVTMLLSEHSPGAHFRGFIDHPLAPPARARDYRMAECYAILVAHRAAPAEPGLVAADTTALINASAGFRPGMLTDRTANTAYLGIGTLGKRDTAFMNRYWQETVQTVGARVVVPIHWDDFTKPATKPLVPMPRLADDLDRSLRFLRERAAPDAVQVRLPRVWEPADFNPVL
ncbi:MAG: MBL fold metallo-hydrolase [Candidatus Nanopelagicales bacterium]|nr:MBL fold metallo-hydrolase [Candidatus Nanopelagicales bacterium]